MALVKRLIFTCLELNIIFQVRYIGGMNPIRPPLSSRLDNTEQYGMNKYPEHVPCYLRPTAFVKICWL